MTDGALNVRGLSGIGIGVSTLSRKDQSAEFRIANLPDLL